jgi:hypothetical protein
MGGRGMNILGIIGAVVSVMGLLITSITVIVKLNTSITKLTCAVDNLKEYTASNAKCHEEFVRALGNHETRITVLEDWRKGAE